MGHADHRPENPSATANSSLIRWRPWPCQSCGGGATALSHLVRSTGSGQEFPDDGRNERIDRQKAREARMLAQWVRRCQHTEWIEVRLPDLAEGSEHLVYFDNPSGEVVKVTRIGIYGDYYEMIDGRITQFDSTPAEYLLRMNWWETLFSTAPVPKGLTEGHQIVSRQTYIHANL